MQDSTYNIYSSKIDYFITWRLNWQHFRFTQQSDEFEAKLLRIRIFIYRTIIETRVKYFKQLCLVKTQTVAA